MYAHLHYPYGAYGRNAQPVRKVAKAQTSNHASRYDLRAYCKSIRVQIGQIVLGYFDRCMLYRGILPRKRRHTPADLLRM